MNESALVCRKFKYFLSYLLVKLLLTDCNNAKTILNPGSDFPTYILCLKNVNLTYLTCKTILLTFYYTLVFIKNGRHPGIVH